MQKIYREGPIGALLDEYERAAEELKEVILPLDVETYTKILDAHTEDPDCKSVQTIMNHVVRAGYGYANYIRKQFGDPFTERKETYEVHTPSLACSQMDAMFGYTIETLHNKSNITFEKILGNIIKTTWGQHYDLDQLMEHAIVHLLRHRRQIQKLLLKK